MCKMSSFTVLKTDRTWARRISTDTEVEGKVQIQGALRFDGTRPSALRLRRRMLPTHSNDFFCRRSIDFRAFPLPEFLPRTPYGALGIRATDARLSSQIPRLETHGYPPAPVWIEGVTITGAEAGGKERLGQGNLSDARL